MFEYLAQLDVADFEVEVEHPPLLVFPVVKIAPPIVIFDPVVTGEGVASGCWTLEHWDGFENIGVYCLAEGGRVAMSFEEASEYLSHDW